MAICNDPRYTIAKLTWMRGQGIWPNGLRYLWTDAFGLVLLLSLYAESGERRYLDQAESLVAEVIRVLGRPRGIRIGEAPDRDGQYFHYLAMWLYALSILGRHIPDYRKMGVELVGQIHEAFVVPGRGVIWKMKEDLSGRYPGYGFGALDAFDGCRGKRRVLDQLSSQVLKVLHQVSSLVSKNRHRSITDRVAELQREAIVRRCRV